MEATPLIQLQLKLLTFNDESEHDKINVLELIDSNGLQLSGDNV